MRETPIPSSQAVEERLETEKLLLAQALERSRHSLLLKPRPGPYQVAQGVLFPLLDSLGFDVFDLRVLRLMEDSSEERVTFRLHGATHVVTIELRSATSPLRARSRDSDRADLQLTTNGRSWLAQAAGTEVLAFELLKQGFGPALATLLGPNGSSRQRLASARQLLEAAEHTGSRVPLVEIPVDEVERHAAAVSGLRGGLRVTFRGTQVAITSRSAYYYVLASLSLEHGREDAIPAQDLLRPPDEPDGRERSRPLPRPGWHLLLERSPEVIERNTEILLEALRLRKEFSASQRGRTYPCAKSRD